MNLPVEICLTTCLPASAYFKGRVVLLLTPPPPPPTLPSVTFDFLLPDTPPPPPSRVQNKTELYICQVVVTVESGPTSSSFRFSHREGGGGGLSKAVRSRPAPQHLWLVFFVFSPLFFVCSISCVVSSACLSDVGMFLVTDLWHCSDSSSVSAGLGLCMCLSSYSAWWKREFLPPLPLKKNDKTTQLLLLQHISLFLFLNFLVLFLLLLDFLIVFGEKKILLLSLSLSNLVTRNKKSRLVERCVDGRQMGCCSIYFLDVILFIFPNYKKWTVMVI